MLLTPREFFELSSSIAHAVERLPPADQHDVDRRLDELYSAYLDALRENERLHRLLAGGGLYHKLQEVNRS